jgi:hypothetical protein
MSVRKDTKQGTWHFVVHVAGANGKRQQLRRRGFATRKKAEAAEAQVIADRSRGLFVRPSRVTLEDFLLGEWLTAKRAGLRPSTAHAYGRLVELHIAPTIGAAQLAEIDGSMLNGLYGRLLTVGRTETRRALVPDCHRRQFATSTARCRRPSATGCDGDDWCATASISPTRPTAKRQR